jgi:hypothetical protein
MLRVGMTDGSPVPGRVPVTVVAGHRSADLALPGAVPVAELLPSLVEHATLLDPASSGTGYRLSTYDGRVLVQDRGLAAQGVTPGALLVLEPVPEAGPRRYDDVVEAVADARRVETARWVDEISRRLTFLTVAAVLLLGAVGLAGDHESAAAPVASVGVTMALLLGAWTLSRVVGSEDLAGLAAMSACAYAATSGLVLAWGHPLLGVPAAAAGGVCAATAALAAVGLAEGRVILLVPVIAGAVFLAAGCAARVLDPESLLTAVVVLAVAASPAFPTLAVTVTRTGHLGPAPDDGDPCDGVDVTHVAHDVRLAHRLVAALTGAVGVLVLLVAPLATSSGLLAASPIALAALVLLLGPSDRRGALGSLVGTVSGTSGLVTIAAVSLWLHPQWRPVLAPALAAVALLLLLGACTRTGAPSARRTRTRELIEAAALVGLAPGLVLAVGSSVGVHLSRP